MKQQQKQKNKKLLKQKHKNKQINRQQKHI